MRYLINRYGIVLTAIAGIALCATVTFASKDLVPGVRLSRISGRTQPCLVKKRAGRSAVVGLDTCDPVRLRVEDPEHFYGECGNGATVDTCLGSVFIPLPRCARIRKVKSRGGGHTTIEYDHLGHSRKIHVKPDFGDREIKVDGDD